MSGLLLAPKNKEQESILHYIFTDILINNPANM